MPRGSIDRTRVVIVGGGIAALEALLALRELADGRVDVTLISAEPSFVYRPAATVAPFAAAAVPVYSLAAIAADQQAALRIDTVEAVAPAARTLRLSSGGHLAYDTLVLAPGARRRAGIPGAALFRDQRDVRLLRSVVTDVDAGRLRRLAIGIPSGVAWTLPAYELALVVAARADAAGTGTEVVVVTPERAPLAVAGPTVSEAVAAALADAGVGVLCGAVPRVVHHDRLDTVNDGSVPADRVLAIPRLVGVPISGVPSDWHGFVPVDAHGRVEGLADVFAVGDVTSFPVKQGGVAAEQAEVAAGVIAAAAGAPVEPVPFEPVLRARLAGGPQELFVRADLDAEGRVRPGGRQVVVTGGEPTWWPAAKVYARHLPGYLAGLDTRLGGLSAAAS